MSKIIKLKNKFIYRMSQTYEEKEDADFNFRLSQI